MVARQMDEGDCFSPSVGGKLPARSPFAEGQKMGRGAAFAPRFREFVETGGVARHKHCVVMNVRLNELRDIDTANGEGSFLASFFLDLAFWVPVFDSDHFESMATAGVFSKFEPVLEFPEVDASKAGHLRWGRRDAEFSGGSARRARQHEVQLGQNYETPCVSADKKTKFTVSVVDPGSHWPRLWRVCLDDDEIDAMAALDRKSRKKLEPTNERPHQCAPRLFELFARLDHQRALDLPHPDEGVVFVTHEITCVHRTTFALSEFPFDMHDLKIIVRLDRADGDPLSRAIVPAAHDKAFFVSSRVAKLVDWHLARNLDWSVTREPVSLGGFQRLNAAAIIRRKPGYFVRNFIVIIFLLTSSTFAAFNAPPNDMSTRMMVVFTSLLAIISFKFGGDPAIPTPPYPTILDTYIMVCFYVNLFVMVVTMLFTVQCTMGGIMSGNPKRLKRDVQCQLSPGHWYGLGGVLPAYNVWSETLAGLAIFVVWIGTNYWYWHRVWHRVQFNLRVVDQVGIGWMVYKFKGRKAMKGKYDAGAMVRDLKLEADLRAKKEAEAKAAKGGAATSPESNQPPKASLPEPPRSVLTDGSGSGRGATSASGAGGFRSTAGGSSTQSPAGTGAWQGTSVPEVRGDVASKQATASVDVTPVAPRTELAASSMAATPVATRSVLVPPSAKAPVTSSAPHPAAPEASAAALELRALVVRRKEEESLGRNSAAVVGGGEAGGSGASGAPRRVGKGPRTSSSSRASSRPKHLGKRPNRNTGKQAN